MEITCIAIEDEPLALEQIKSYINRHKQLRLLGAYDNAIDAHEAIVQLNPQLLFADINLPDMTGLDLVSSLHKAPKVIFTTAYREYALEGFELDAADYLLKPLSYAKFLKAVDKVIDRYFSITESVKKNEKEEDIQLSDDCLFIKSEYRIVRINYSEITFIESMHEYIRIHLINDKPIMTLMAIKKMEEYLPATLFMRVHRSYIVNLSKVKVIERSRIVFGKDYIPISEAYRNVFNEYLDTKFLK